MDKLNSYSDYAELLRLLNVCYGLSLEDICLHREMIGRVYYAKSGEKGYVLKLYRPFNTEQALQSISILEYLRLKDYPAVTVVPTADSSLFLELSAPDGQCVGVLYDFVQGTEPDLCAEISQVGRQVGELHRLMEQFPKDLVRRGKEFYIDRFLTILQQLEYPDARVKELSDYGREMWARIEQLPKGFCHGDMHSGNMLQTGPGVYILFDFDVSSMASPVVDVASLSNKTHFNRYEESSYEVTVQELDRFYQGYSLNRILSDAEIAAVFDFVAVRHYELIATITECQGLEGLSESFLNQQYEWLMNWRNLCIQKGL